MSETRYQVNWLSPSSAAYTVSLLLDPESVKLANTNEGIKGSHARLTICTKVRECLHGKHPVAGMMPIMFNNLLITPLSVP